jgi:hypothetical protein
MPTFRQSVLRGLLACGAVAFIASIAATAARADKVLDTNRPTPRAHLVVIKGSGSDRVAYCRRNASKTELIVGIRNEGNAESKRHSFSVTFVHRNAIAGKPARWVPAIGPGSRVSFHIPIKDFLVKNRYEIHINDATYPGSRVGALCLP